MNKRDSMSLVVASILSLAAAFISPRPALALDTVTLQLKWTHCFQFAGYYAAQELGYYREAGLDVRFEEGLPGVDVVDRVVTGRAQFGVGTSSLLLARASGQPVVVLAVIFQHSPLVLIAREQSGIQSIHDLVGKRVMIEPEADEIFAYLKREGIDAERLVRVEHGFDVKGLVDGRVDAMTAYVTNEPELLDRLNLRYQTYTPRSAGIDFYADNLFTSERELNRHPERVRAFRAASLHGWKYAMAHPDQIIDLILKKYAGTDTREHYRFEAEKLASLLHPELIEIGYMNPGRWKHIAEVYAEVGLLPADLSLKGYLYEPNPKVDLTWTYRIVFVTVSVSLLVGGVAIYILHINQRLRKSLIELQRTQERLQVFSMAIDQSPTSVVITGPDASIQYVNPYFTEETGYTMDEVIGKNPHILNSGLTPQSTFQEMWGHLTRGEPWIGELINRRKSGEVYWEEAHIAPVKDATDFISHYVAVKLDITVRKKAFERLAFMAHHDALTSLPNRTLFFERVTQGIALARRNGTRLALMFVDLDKFKPINDHWGHDVGDRVLQEVAVRMQGSVRVSDTVGRIGGDEFVVLVLDVSGTAETVVIAEKIRQALNRPYIVDDKRLTLSSSIGLAIFPDHGRDTLTLTRNADLAMYHAKEGGRDTVAVFTTDRR
jgi:diguanylate cyclase (GGDEF)-like protein/PAS domain S-box-containing protein